MTILNTISLLGGLALFLYGMSVMGDGLEKVSGGKLERILEKLTRNLLMGVLLGFVVTGVIQSSSATTVMVVGFVNSGIMRLSQAVGVIFGANIGTTVTSFLLSLGDISSDSVILKLLKPTSLAPLVSVMGLILVVIQKNGKRHDIGTILLGFGILFFGMTTMETAVHPLRENEFFIRMMTAVSNPFLGVAVGAIFTAIIQSSSASVGILQALSATGAIRFNAAAPIILGQNIGTCVTALLSSIGASKNAKRAAMIHFYFNVLGTLIFIALLYGLEPFLRFTFWESTMNRSSIAIFHLIFNISSTLLLLPFNKVLVKLAVATIREKALQPEQEANLLDERFLASPSLALDKTRDVVQKMGEIAIKNYRDTVELMKSYDVKAAERIREMENVLDKHEVRVEDYLVKLTDRSLTSEESMRVSDLLHAVGDFERIGDYTINLIEVLEQLRAKNIVFTSDALEEANHIINAVGEILGITYESFAARDIEKALTVEPLEQVIDLMKDYLKEAHINRLKSGSCSIEAGMLFIDLITNLERISDHCSHIAVEIIQRQSDDKKNFDFHTYLRTIHEGKSPEYSQMFTAYHKKYLTGLLEKSAQTGNAEQICAAPNIEG